MSSDSTLQRSTNVSPIPIIVSFFQALTCSDNELPLLFQLPTWEPPTFFARYLHLYYIILAEINKDRWGNEEESNLYRGAYNAIRQQTIPYILVSPQGIHMIKNKPYIYFIFYLMIVIFVVIVLWSLVKLLKSDIFVYK